MDNRQNSVGGGLVHKIGFDDVISLENLFAAWKQFRKGKRSKSDVAEFELNLEENLFDLHDRLRSGTWLPDSYHVFYVNDPKQRKIHKASVRDRVLYQAVYRSLYQIFDRGFIFHSYSSRNYKGTHAGVNVLEKYIRQITDNHTRPAFTLKCDIRKFFDSIDHQILFDLISTKITDPRLLSLINKILTSYSLAPGKGLPLGNVTSQLFANVYMNELDQHAKRVLKVKCYLRYCDDFAIVSDSREQLKKYIDEVGDFCRQELLLDLHPRKLILRKVHQGTDFLGYVLLPHRRVLRTRTKNRALQKMLDLRDLIKEPIRESDRERIDSVKQSYLGMLSHCNGKRVGDQIKSILPD